MKYDWVEIQKMYDSGMTQREIQEKIGIASKSFRWAKKRGDFVPRSRSDALKLSNSNKPKRILTEEHKKKISNGLKIAHQENRAWNIGKSRWKNEPSYPEKFFMKVIENEFEDKNYTRELPFDRYSLDFAWVDKKKCIEIDGEQHQRFEEYKERDRSKDEILISNGWKVLRIVWKEMFNDPKKFIELSNTFIGK